MTLVRKVNGVNTNITRVVRVENSVVTEIGSIVQVDNGVLTTRFGSGSTDFTTADAGIDFTVSRPGLVSLSIATGSFVNINPKDGDILGTVTVDTTRTLGGFIQVPNDSMWSNAGELIVITGISTTQPGPFTPPPAEDRNRYSETFLDTVNAFNNVVDGTPVVTDCTNNNTDTFIHEISCFTRTTTTGNTPRYTLTCIAADGCDLPDGTIVDNGPVITGTSSVEVCGDCTATNNGNPNYVPIFSLTDVVQYISVRIVPETGEVVAISNNDVVSVVLAPGQQKYYTPLPAGSDPVVRTINLILSGTIPADYQNAGSAYSFDYSAGASQRAAAILPPVVSASIMYQTSGFGFNTIYPTNGSIVSIIDFPVGGQYIVVGSSTNGGTVTGDRGFYGGSTTGRTHTLTATNTAGTDTITFTVRTNTI